VFTDLIGCRKERLKKPLEDFIAEFVGEVYF
jgi:hypothetical protein